MAAKASKASSVSPDFLKKFDPEKLRALEKFMKKKGLSLEQEMLKSLENLFSRHVPKDVREFLSGDDDEPETNPAEAKSDSPGEENTGENHY